MVRHGLCAVPRFAGATYMSAARCRVPRRQCSSASLFSLGGSGWSCVFPTTQSNPMKPPGPPPPFFMDLPTPDREFIVLCSESAVVQESAWVSVRVARL